MTLSDVGQFVLSLATRAVVVLPIHLVLLWLLPKFRARIGVGRLKLLCLAALLPMAMFLVPDLFSATAGSGAISYAAAFGVELGREVIVASSRAMPEVCSVAFVGLTCIWALGAIVVSGSRVLGLLRLKRVVSRRTVWSARHGRITLRYIDGGIASPVTYGLIAPEIVIPMSATEDEVLCRMLKRHELAHIENLDILLRYATTFLCAVYWFYPPIFRIERELCTLSELACDAEALSLVPSRATDYGRMLVAYSRQKTSTVGLGSRLSDGGRSLLLRLESIVEPRIVTRKMKRFGAILLAVAIVLSVGASTFQAMVCGTRELTLFEATIDVPGYLGVIRENDNTVFFTLGGSVVGAMLRLRSRFDFDAFYSSFEQSSIYRHQSDGDYTRGSFTRRGRSGSFFVFTDELLGTRDTYALCLYDTPMMGLFSMVEMARSVEKIRNSDFGVRNYESADRFSLAADLEHFFKQ